jgi:hypothetical protein
MLPEELTERQQQQRRHHQCNKGCGQEIYFGALKMTKLDLALISQLGHDRAVPKEMDRHMVKYIVGQRKTAVERAVANNDNSPFVTNRWDHSDVFYPIRTHLNRLGWDTFVYTDTVEGGSKRRKALYDMIQGVCENYIG